MTAQLESFGPPANADAHTIQRQPTAIDLATQLMKYDMSGDFVERYIVDLTDAELPRVHEAIITALRMHTESFRTVANALVNEAGRRMKERKASALPDTEFEVVLEPQWSEYTRDVDAAIAAAFLLPEEEAAKVVKFIPERTEVVPARHEVGHPASIAALRRKYAGSDVDNHLARALSRVSLDPKVVMRRRKGATSEVAS